MEHTAAALLRQLWGEAELLTKGLGNLAVQVMGQAQEPLSFPQGTKGQPCFDGATAAIQGALPGHLPSQGLWSSREVLRRQLREAAHS